MTTPSSGTIGVNHINVEIGRASNANTNLNESIVRQLGQVPSGTISLSNFYGKSLFNAIWSGDSIASWASPSYTMGFQVSSNLWRGYYSGNVGAWSTGYTNGTFSATTSLGNGTHGFETSGNLCRARASSGTTAGNWISFSIASKWATGTSAAGGGIANPVFNLDAAGGLLRGGTTYGYNATVYGPYRSLT